MIKEVRIVVNWGGQERSHWEETEGGFEDTGNVFLSLDLGAFYTGVLL